MNGFLKGKSFSEETFGPEAPFWQFAYGKTA